MDQCASARRPSPVGMMQILGVEAALNPLKEFSKNSSGFVGCCLLFSIFPYSTFFKSSFLFVCLFV